MKMEEQIAEFVRDNPVLWDKNHLEYKNIKAKDKQWFRLANILGIPVNTVKRRWKTMRDYYRNLQRQDVTISTNRNRITKYKYGGMLDFLDETQKKVFKTEPSTYDNYYSDDSNHNCNEEQMIMVNDKDDMKYECNDTIAISEVICPLEANAIRNNTTVHSDHLSNLRATQEKLNIAREAANFNNSPAHLFMLSLALQIDKANLSPEVFLNLQIKMLKLVKDEIKQQK